jgi:hypothetical protein
VADEAHQLLHLDSLCRESVGSAPDGRKEMTVVFVHSQNDDRGPGMPALDGARHVEARHRWQADIE